MRVREHKIKEIQNGFSKNTRILLLFLLFGQVVNVHLGRLNSLKLNTHSLSLLDF